MNAILTDETIKHTTRAFRMMREAGETPVIGQQQSTFIGARCREVAVAHE